MKITKEKRKVYTYVDVNVISTSTNENWKLHEATAILAEMVVALKTAPESKNVIFDSVTLGALRELGLMIDQLKDESQLVRDALEADDEG